MDWIELLIVIVFFGAPLIGRLFQQKPPAPPPTLPPGDVPGEGAWAPTLPAPARTGAGLPAPAGTAGGWSAGWGQWPEIATEEEEDEELVDDEEGIAAGHDLDADSIHTREALSLEPVASTEVALRPLPGEAVALDAPVVDRGREHERFHQKYFKPAAPPPRSERPADHLRSRSEVRRAMLLAEVLGPPRALQGLEGDR